MRRDTTIELILLLLLAGCSTEKNTLVTRSYHNLTSRYNIFFNGNESFKKGEKRMQDAHTDDFTRILPVFLYGDDNLASTIAPDMERAIQKATKVIRLHSITVKPVFDDGPGTEKQKAFYEQNEYNRFVPENYLLMGKAYLYRHDYMLAVETFKFVISEYHYDKIIYEARMWLARTYDELGDFDEAENILEVLEGSAEFPDQLKTDLYATLADHYTKQEDYERAIEPMTLAAGTVRNKQDKIRYNYILAQLYQEAGQPGQASLYYQKVIKLNPTYEMSFNSHINRASVFVAGTDGEKELRDELEKMLKDEKNRDFRDRIYYALGDMYFREGNVEEALDHYKMSSEISSSNSQQKTSSCLTIAEIYYQQREYELAGRYYDSAKMYMTEESPGYESIIQKTSSLSSLVQNLQVIQREDSLQRLARMDQASRFAVIDNIIARLQLNEQIAREEEIRTAQDQQYNRMALIESQNAGFSADQGGKWYFYNTAAKGFGQPEFRMKWGNRKLEDNWRRSNKSEVTFGEPGEAAADTAGVEQQVQRQVLSDKSREFYLRDIPMTDSMMKRSDERVIESLYNVGTIYDNDLKDSLKSIETYRELLNRYPGNDYTLSVYYNLYNLYDRENNIQMANMYRESIIREFPGSRPAVILTNPDYMEELKAEANAANLYYEQTYQNYRLGQYDRVILKVDTALVRFRGDPLLPKFQFLKVLSLGRTGDIMDFTQALDSLASSTPDREVAESANDILSYILGSDENVRTTTRSMEAEEIYNVDSTGTFFYGMIIDSTVDINQLKFEFINFNLDHYPNRTFDVVHEQLKNNEIILYVKRLPDPRQARTYADLVSADDKISGVLEGVEFKSMIISASNAEILRQDGMGEKYWLFYQKHYIR